MKKWLRNILKQVAVEVLKRNAELVIAVNEAIEEIYDNIAELGDSSALLTYQNTAFNSDGSITQTNDNVKVVTAFSYDENGNRKITETAVDSETGKTKYTKVITFTEDAATKKKTVKEEWIR